MIAIRMTPIRFAVALAVALVLASPAWAQRPEANAEPCTGVIPIGQTATADLHTFTALGRICSVVVAASAAIQIALVEGTGSNCGTGTTALIGTVANPVPLTTTISLQAVGGTYWLQTQVPADHLCLLQTGAGTLAGVITYFDTKMPGR